MRLGVVADVARSTRARTRRGMASSPSRLRGLTLTTTSRRVGLERHRSGLIRGQEPCYTRNKLTVSHKTSTSITSMNRFSMSKTLLKTIITYKRTKKWISRYCGRLMTVMRKLKTIVKRMSMAIRSLAAPNASFLKNVSLQFASSHMLMAF